MPYVLILLLAGAFTLTQVDDIKTSFNRVEPVTIMLTGDIMLGRYVETLIKRHGDGYPFEHIASTTRQADVVIGNLEGTIPTDHTQTPNGDLTFSFASNTPAILQDAHFTHMSLANNHSLDKKISGYVDTVKALHEKNITAVGRADNTTCSTIIQARKKTIGLIALNDTWGGVTNKRAAECVGQVQAESDFIIAYVHWGDEYAKANERQKALARVFIDNGVDAVIGHHPHVVQETEWYKGKPILYSLGNLVFDQYFSEAVQMGLIVEITLGKKAEFRLHSVTSSQSQPKSTGIIELTEDAQVSHN